MESFVQRPHTFRRASAEHERMSAGGWSRVIPGYLTQHPPVGRNVQRVNIMREHALVGVVTRSLMQRPGQKICFQDNIVQEADAVPQHFY